ncbi:MAG: Maf family nucleotide pyrophosphatase [Zoogloeaceae bacterium]|nr:Maf family nucleotide pyrophosphatase [Zoogloeaceae bacterium]
MSRPRIYLASRSPRRRELLRQIDVDFDLLLFREGERTDGDVDETPHAEENVEAYVARLAVMKAEAGARRVAMRQIVNRPVLGADTTLEVDGEIIGKPASREDAANTLERLSGRSHRVLTAVALADGRRPEHLPSISEVRFRELSRSEIRHYVATGEPMDKAGAYGIQGRAAIFVADIRGSHSGIMGLPLYETAQLLARFGLPVL